MKLNLYKFPNILNSKKVNPAYFLKTDEHLIVHSILSMTLD